MSEDKKMELNFNNVNLKCEGYSIKDIISLLKSVGVTTTDVFQSTTKTLKKTVVEEVNLKDLGKTVRMPKTTSDFRCPSCGQALLAFYQPEYGENTLLVRNINSSDVATYKANIIDLPKIKGRDNFIDVYKDLLDLLGEKVVLVENSKDMCNCPYCLSESSISDWINAYNNPLDVFEMSDICDICGCEASAVITQTGDYKECENNCIEKLNEVMKQK